MVLHIKLMLFEGSTSVFGISPSLSLMLSTKQKDPIANACSTCCMQGKTTS